MGMIVIGIIGFIAFLYFTGKDPEDLKKEVLQEAININKYNTERFYKYLVPVLDDLQLLEREKITTFLTGKKLEEFTPLELGMYLSYPKTFVIDENDELFVNGIDMGSARYNKAIFQEYGGCLPKYNFIKNDCNGKLVVKEYKYSESWTDLLVNRCSGELPEQDIDLCQRSFKNMRNEQEKVKKDYEKLIKHFYNVLPEEYKKLYEDFQEHQYSIDEMKEKYNNLYKNSKDKYLEKVSKNKKDNINNTIKNSKECIEEYALELNSKIDDKEDKKRYHLLKEMGYTDEYLIKKYAHGFDEKLEKEFGLNK